MTSRYDRDIITRALEVARGDRKPETMDEAFFAVCLDIGQTLIDKQKGYGKGNILEFRETGLIVRMSDKKSRLKNMIIDNPQHSEDAKKIETKEDTYRDMAGYSVIGMLLNRKLEKENSKSWFEDLELEE